MAKKEKFEIPENVAEDLAVKTKEVKSESKAANENDIVTVTADKLNVRSETTASSKVVVIVSKNDNLLVDKSFKSREWFKVTTMNGENGFVMKQFVK